jgi:1-acyl-sn-glycerol-3-phosphate acyltransferase
LLCKSAWFEEFRDLIPGTEAELGVRMSASGRVRQGAKILVSGVLFSMLGIGGMLVSALVIPLLKLAPGDALAHQRRGRWLIHVFFKAFVWALEASGILRLEVEGLPDPRDLAGKLILANHPGYLDVVLIISVLGESACVVKEPVYKNLLFGGLVREAGHVPNLDPEGVIAAGVAALAQGNSLIVFPEGTRTILGTAMHFQRGAAHIALGSQAPIVPLFVSCEPPLLEKGAKWYNVPVQTCRYRLRVQAPLTFDLPGIEHLSPYQAARLLTEKIERHFNKEVNESRDHSV